MLPLKERKACILALTRKEKKNTDSNKNVPKCFMIHMNQEKCAELNKNF